MSESEALKAVVWRFLDEIWHQGNLQVIDEVIAPNYVRHTSHYREGGREVQGPEGARQSIAAFRGAFPDVHFTVEDMLVADEKVVVRWTCRGTHRGAFLGVAPTGKGVTFTGINIYRIANNQIVERWAAEDGISLYQQLGLLAPRS
jgi:steroid delta-isomerase-like uncharacterized protein